MKRNFLLLSILISALLTITLLSPRITNPKPTVLADYSPSEIIIKYKTTTQENEKEKLRKNLKTLLRYKIQKLNIDVVKIQEGSVEEKIKQYQANPQVLYAEPNFRTQAFAITNDTSLTQQWGLFKINAANDTQPSAWDTTTGDPTIKIAILDTGIETSHPELSEKIITSANFTDSPTTSDQAGHGTHVAGIAAAASNNGNGIAGAGYNTSLLNGKVLGDNGSGYYSWLASGIIWAADQGAQVINMSLGGSSASTTLEDAINYAWNKGSVIVAAAGNSGNSQLNYPGYYQNVIAVAATDTNDAKASFSTYGNWVDVAAPGVSIYSTYKDNSYSSLSGTSMATPFAAGTSALIWAKGTCATNTCVREQLEKTADPINGTGTYWTWGRINAYSAVSDITLSPTATPSATPTNTPTPTASPTPTPTPSPTDTTQPTISITYPANGTIVPRRRYITVTASADDNIGITKVIFYRNNNKTCAVAGPTPDKTYNCVMYTSNSRTKVTYKAVGYDSSGNYSSSTVIVTAK